MAMRGLEIGFLLDRQWHALRGEMDGTKRPALVTIPGSASSVVWIFR